MRGDGRRDGVLEVPPIVVRVHVRVRAHAGSAQPAAACHGGRVALVRCQECACEPHAAAVERQELGYVGREAEVLGGVEDGARYGVRERSAGIAGDEQGRRPPLLGWHRARELVPSEPGRGIGNVAGIPRQVDRSVADLYRERVGFGAARPQDSGVAGRQAAEVGGRRADGKVGASACRAEVPVEVAERHGADVEVAHLRAEEVGAARSGMPACRVENER